jgi:hypothetical protein
MLHFTVALCQPGADFLRIILERAVAAFVANASGFVDDVEPLRPGGVSVIRAVAHFIDAEGNRKFKALREIVGDGHTVFNGPGLGIADVIFFLGIGLHLPFVGGMSLANVNGQKIDMVLVILVDLSDVANLAAEGRSSEAAEDKHERPSRDFFANVKARGTVKRDQPCIRGLIPHFQIAAMHVRKRVTHHVQGILRAAGHEAEQHIYGNEKDCQKNQNPFERHGHKVMGARRAAPRGAPYSAREISR